MSEPYLSAILEEAERVAQYHSQIARSTDQPAHKYQYAVLRLLEGEADETTAGVSEIDGVTVGYGADDVMFDSWGDDGEWWETVPPREECPRFRMFYPGRVEPSEINQQNYGLMAFVG
ncbi:hypothetical protein LQ368_16240 [Halobacterium noricense]|nr:MULTISPECIES: hypothetical protein [Halobacterium]MCG1004963.1 hypothetical protein [Halobacterium noricense]